MIAFFTTLLLTISVTVSAHEVKTFEQAAEEVSEKAGRTPIVAVVGGSKIQEDSPEYRSVVEVVSALANIGYGVVTGAGPGVMAAANQAARNQGTPSFGIDVPAKWDPLPNPFVDDFFLVDSIATRKALFSHVSHGYFIAYPGLGTLDELITLWTEVYCGVRGPTPIVLWKSEVWEPLVSGFLGGLASRYGTVSHETCAMVTMVDRVEDVVGIFAKQL